MKFELKPNQSYKIEIDEDAILDLFINLGIERDKMEVDFDTHEYFTHNDGMIIIDFTEKFPANISNEMVEEMLAKEFDHNPQVAFWELTTDDDGLPCVNIGFTYPIYNENEYGY